MKGIELVEVIETKSVMPQENSKTIKTNPESGENSPNFTQAMTQATAQNFDKILNLVAGLIEIGKMKVASDAVLNKMEADRQQLLAEAEVYVKKKNADTKSIVERMNVIRLMMQDFYAHSQGNLSGDDFCKIITEVVNQMGRVEDGIR